MNTKLGGRATNALWNAATEDEIREVGGFRGRQTKAWATRVVKRAGVSGMKAVRGCGRSTLREILVWIGLDRRSCPHCGGTGVRTVKARK